MPTIYTEATRRVAFRDRDGVDTIVKAKDAVEKFIIDWSDALDSSETISSATWTASGIALSGETISGQTTYAMISATSGRVTVKIVTSLARTLVRSVRFLDSGDPS